MRQLFKLCKVLILLSNYTKSCWYLYFTWFCYGIATSGLDGSKLDDSCQRRLNQDNSSESGQQFSSRLRPTLYVLPFPAILVGYFSI